MKTTKEHREHTAIARKVAAASTTDPTTQPDAVILDSLIAIDPTISEQEADHRMGQVLHMLDQARELNRPL